MLCLSHSSNQIKWKYSGTRLKCIILKFECDSFGCHLTTAFQQFRVIQISCCCCYFPLDRATVYSASLRSDRSNRCCYVGGKQVLTTQLMTDRFRMQHVPNISHHKRIQPKDMNSRQNKTTNKLTSQASREKKNDHDQANTEHN